MKKIFMTSLLCFGVCSNVFADDVKLIEIKWNGEVLTNAVKEAYTSYMKKLKNRTYVVKQGVQQGVEQAKDSLARLKEWSEQDIEFEIKITKEDRDRFLVKLLSGPMWSLHSIFNLCLEERSVTPKEVCVDITKKLLKYTTPVGLYQNLTTGQCSAHNLKLSFVQRAKDDEFLYPSKSDFDKGIGYECDTSAVDNASKCLVGNKVTVKNGFFQGMTVSGTFRCAKSKITGNDYWEVVKDGVDQNNKTAQKQQNAPSMEYCDIVKDTTQNGVDCSSIFPNADTCEKSCVVSTWRYKITSCKNGLTPDYQGMNCIGTPSVAPQQIGDYAPGYPSHNEICDSGNSQTYKNIPCPSKWGATTSCDLECIAGNWTYSINGCQAGSSKQNGLCMANTYDLDRKAGAECLSDELPDHAVSGYYIKSSAGRDGLKCAARTCENGYYVPENNGVPQGWCKYGTDPKVENARLEAERAEYQRRAAEAPLESGGVKLLTVAPLQTNQPLSMPGREVSNPALVAQNTNTQVTPPKSSSVTQEDVYIKSGPLADAGGGDSDAMYGKTGMMDF